MAVIAAFAAAAAVALTHQDDAGIAELVDALASDSVLEREQALGELSKLGPDALPTLDRAAARTRDPEARASLDRIRQRLRQAARSQWLAASVSQPTGTESKLMSDLVASDPESVLQAVSRIAGRAAVLRDGRIRFVALNDALKLPRADLVLLLREALHRAPAEDSAWIETIVTALGAVREHRLHELLPSVSPLVGSRLSAVREHSIRAVGRAAAAIEDRGPWIPRILKALTDRTAEVREAAAGALIAMGGREHLPALIRLRRDADPEVRRRVVDAIVEWRAADRMPTLLELARDEQPGVRRRAIQGIATLRGSAQIARLEPLLDDPDEHVRLEYLNLIYELDHRESAARAARALGDGCTFVRARALEILTRFEAAEHAEAVAGLLDDHEFERIRLGAIRFLGAYGSPAQVPNLVRLLKAARTDVRAGSLEALISLEARDASGAIAALLDDPSEPIRRRALAALIQWKVEPEALQHLLSKGSQEEAVAVACMLAECGDGSGRDVLLRALDSNHRGLRARAVLGLNALMAPATHARLRETRVADRTYDGVPLSAVLGSALAESGISVRFDLEVAGKFTLRTAAPLNRGGELLVHLMASTESEFAVLLDSDCLRVVDVAEARRAADGLARTPDR